MEGWAPRFSGGRIWHDFFVKWWLFGSREIDSGWLDEESLAQGSYDRLPAAALKGIGFNGILFEKPDSLALSVMPIMKPKKIIQVFQGYNFVMAGWQRALSLLIVIVIVAVAVAVVVAVAAAAAVAFAVAVVVTAAATVSYDRLPAAALKGIGFNGICKWTHLFWWKHY
ncbi:hypothetical protein KSS87_004285 [Heliosperma pusillum]|nr:hypothetical protein KSS87_004285 [Heliosperma pusillum]